MNITDEGKRSQKFVIIDSQPSIPKSISVRAYNNITSENSETADNVDPLNSETREASGYNKKKLAKHKIIHPGMKNKEVLNSFRSLRMSLLSKMDKVNSIILVSSVITGGGASFTALNLATAFTLERGRRALVVDCNRRNPSLDKTLGVETSSGLCDYLSGKINDISELVYSTEIPRVNLVPCGGQNSEEDIVELFNSNRMNQFLSDVKERSDDRVVILDTPPVLDSADTKILAGLSDLIVVSFPYKGVTAARVTKTVEELGGKDSISGFVMVN